MSPVALLRTEWRKLVTTRLWWVLALVMLVYLGFTAVVLAASFALAPAETAPDLAPADQTLLVLGSLGTAGYVFPLLVGTLLVTSEARHGTFTATFLAEPRRWRVLVAKLAVAVPVGLVLGVAGTLGVSLGLPVLAVLGDGAAVGDPAVVRALVLGVVVTTLWCVLGVALGSVVTNQVAAVVGVLVFTQFVEPVARIALGAVDGAARVASFLPGAAADAVTGASLLGAMTAGSGGPDLLPGWAGALVLLAYGVVLVTVGARTTFRRDVL
ncbi:ABC transporter permease subunit [Nocardioides bruguierae]|uniref:ABC transporter permease subunit n=1 Tax=Nocardioides bruguierae TaxID=2945102 RepID=UPI00202243F2|nr:ABC transporter permease subunit [Nocardioides bruguierae]MCL8027239.1 ABC transporter permease [Nocardioides bruguierae]